MAILEFAQSDCYDRAAIPDTESGTTAVNASANRQESALPPDAPPTRARSRRFVMLVLAALVSSCLLASPSQALLQPSSAAPQVYDDVVTDNVHAANIARLKAVGIFEGTECGPDRFCPRDPLSRRTFAVWMVRVLDGDQAPGFVDPAVGGESPFADVDADEREALLIGRLAELGVTVGCASQPERRYCPDRTVSRAQMASFLARAFNLPTASDAGFEDVSQDNVHRDDINRLSASKITVSCSDKPKLYCPNRKTSRAQMASFLARAIDWRQPETNTSSPDAESDINPGTPVIVTGADHSIVIDVNHDESTNRTTVSWGPSADNPNHVDRYVLQWRKGYQDFDSTRQQTITTNDQQAGRYSFLIPTPNMYAVRVIVVRAGNNQLATAEVWIPSNANRLRDAVKRYAIDPYQNQQPWLRDTWEHMNSPDFAFSVSEYAGRGEVYLDSQRQPGQLKRTWVKGLGMHPRTMDLNHTSTLSTVIHELGHVYTLSNTENDKSGVVGIGYLYFHLLETSHGGLNPESCRSEEFYADMARLLFFDWEFHPTFGTLYGNGGYWAACNLQLDDQEFDQVQLEGSEVARSVFIEQRIPDWFYNTYQKPGGDIDLERLWSDINRNPEHRQTRQIIIYHLRNEFGGYCSEVQVQDYLDGKIAKPNNPWRDGGCEPT